MMIVDTVSIIPLLHIIHIPLLSVVQAFNPAATAPTGLQACTASNNALGEICTLVQDIQTAATGIGAAIFVIGLTIAGMMRMMSFGSERRVMVSNMAITAAVVGLAVMLLANGISLLLTGVFK